mmetsp:Transcript_10317/g.30428  ORF Transcript_10317/g.30428 Transcript_10317/m.30428 type:complete len:139 (+) Transcript_10317:734-1150(+)
MVEHVDHVDLDEGVISVCRDYFSWGKAWDDPRVKLHVADGAAFIRDVEAGSYDVIIQDSSDPFTWDDDGAVIDLPSGVLYSQSHFENLVRVLSPGGALNLQVSASAKIAPFLFGCDLLTFCGFGIDYCRLRLFKYHRT